MAYFDSEELANFIRHQCIINDDDGHCKKILKPPLRKAKPGGLPLNFRSAADSDTSSGEYSPCYLATPNCESTYEVIQERLRSRIHESDLSDPDDEDKAVKNNTTDACSGTPDSEFFQCKDISCTPSPLLVKKSTTALLLEKTDFMIRPDLAAYARFAAPDIEKGRKLLVFYPFAKPELDNGKCFSLTIYAHCDIYISDLVGLCCYEYARCQRTNDIESVTQYHLLMAEENGEVDRDLPSVDGHRLLSELGSCWSTIALEKRQSYKYSEITNVVVYTISGKQYEFSIDSPDVPLRWLRDQTVKKRIEDEGQEFMSDCTALREYILEAAKQPDVVLDLNKPISSVAYSEFLLLRINSSRGDFSPTRCSSIAQGHSSTSKIHDDLISSSFEQQQQCSDVIHKKYRRTSTATSISSSSIDITDSLGNSISFYPVEKIHRYKPKCNALLTIRTDGFELAPNQLDQTRKRNPILLHSSFKTLCVTWNYVGGVEITNHSNSKRRVRIVWLTCPTIKHQSEESKMSELASSKPDSLNLKLVRSIENDELLRQKLCNDACWKILQLETGADDAWNITQQISTIIDNRNSVVHQVYKYSNSGTKKPKKAAAEAFANDVVTEFKGRNSPMVRNVSQLTSTVTSTILKLFSKHN